MKYRSFLAVLLFAASASAQQFSIVATAGKSMASYHGQADLQALHFECSERWSEQGELGIAIGSEFLWQPRTWFGGGNERVRGVNASLVARRYWKSHPSVYAEILTGPMWAQKRVPAQTSHFNFLTQAGAGIVVGSQWRTPLMFGIRFAHVSNAGVAYHNPGMNFSAAVVALRFRR